ncbi:MAG: inositol-3-phosphate synthase [Planctomycetes bacterium]|nr:inositol-3-phosphate synthase [Planctomycetota bacterium]
MKRKVGIFLIGAYGNVATCVVAGTAAIVRGLTDRTGLVTETPVCEGLPLADLPQFVFGGWDVRDGSIAASASDFGERNGLLTPELTKKISRELKRADAEVRPGLLVNATPAVVAMAGAASRKKEKLAAGFKRLQADLRSFRDRHRLDDVIVVNLASTESMPPSDVPALRSLSHFRKAVAKDESEGLPASVVYAVAALDLSFPFIDFTPSVAAGSAPAREAAALRGVPCMGRDGKTGETLLKTVLAPMFVARHLPVMSWVGFNVLGNRDGEVLRQSGALASKVRDKDEALRRILKSDTTHSQVRIDYVPSLEDWKQAYDLVHFKGFLGARMQLHFIWQGCDSALAAPLVIDLVRMTDLARRRGERGTLPWLAPFFKTPIDCDVQDFAAQMMLFAQWCDEARGFGGDGV